jgi:Bacterial Ig domain/WD40-like Beta Propeller Repeat
MCVKGEFPSRPDTGVRSVVVRRLALTLAVLTGTLTLPAAAGAVVGPGPNGPIVFTSGRGGPAGNDDNAKIWVVGSTGGSATQVTTGMTRHSHPAWSPDRTKVAYSKSRTGAGSRDIYVRDLLTGNELQLTNTATEDEDRAAWSPDGSEIAYSVAPTDAFGAPRNIFIRPSTGGPPRNLAISSVASEDKPSWSADGETIYYARDTVPSTNTDIVKEPADDSGPVSEVVNTAANEWQPSISPDGNTICYSRGGMGDSGATGVDLYTADANGTNSNVLPFQASTTRGEFNCAWSPDGTQIVHVRGVFTGGELVVSPFPGPGSPQVISDVEQHFDGNPDWTYNPPPACANASANLAYNSFAVIQLSCSDAPDPPGFLPNDPEPEIATPPANGVLGGIANDSVIYTPNVNFQGTDTFTYKSNDGTSDSPPATVTINVAGPPPDGARGSDTTRPVISRLSLAAQRFRRGRSLPRLAQRAPVGTTIRFSLSEAARTTFTFHRMLPGRRSGRRCVRPNRRNRRNRRCTRFVRAGSFSVNGKAGANRVRFQGRLSRTRRLSPGKYRLTLSARDAAGNRTVRNPTKTFTIVR